MTTLDAVILLLWAAGMILAAAFAIGLIVSAVDGAPWATTRAGRRYTFLGGLCFAGIAVIVGHAFFSTLYDLVGRAGGR
jgi:hypothetical protein